MYLDSEISVHFFAVLASIPVFHLLRMKVSFVVCIVSNDEIVHYELFDIIDLGKNAFQDIMQGRR